MANSRAGNKGGKRALPSMTGALYKMAITLPSEPRAEPKQEMLKGKVTVPNETIIAMRKMHEVDRKSMREVEQAFPMYSQNYVRNVLKYVIRAKLYPPKKE